MVMYLKPLVHSHNPPVSGGHVVDILQVINAEGNAPQATETALQGQPADQATHQPGQTATLVLQDGLHLCVCVCMCKIGERERAYVCPLGCGFPSQDNNLTS